jgi:tetratricopeptide (TPR) repeat protein
MDLRMECLQERLGGARALTEVFSEATGDVVENAVSAANSLASLDRCADVPLLRAIVRPPEDPATRERVVDLRSRLAALKARFDAGNYREALRDAPALIETGRALGYKPLVAEGLILLGTMQYKSDNGVAAERAFVDAFRMADASRHDEVRAEAAADLVYVYGYQKGDFAESHKWADTADSVLHRLGGHDILRAWLLNDLGCVLGLEGRKQEAAQAFEQSLELKQKALGRDHPDVGISEENLAISLQEGGRAEEALNHMDRAIGIISAGLGAGHPDLAIALNNRGETLNALGRYRDARQSFEKARAIWERELGPNSLNLSYALTGIGISLIGEGSPDSALVPLERALKIREAEEKDPVKRSETRFALARALWEARRDRGRARTLAEEARAAYAKSAGGNNKSAEVDRWLQVHGAS